MQNNITDHEIICQKQEETIHNLRALVSHYRIIAEELQEERDILDHIILEMTCRAKMELAEEIFYRLDKGSSKEELEKAVLLSLRNDLGDRDMDGKLQPFFNFVFDGVLDSLTQDYPDLSPLERNMYCSMLTGAKANLLMRVFSFTKVQQVYYAQKRLIKKIWKGKNGRRLKYTALLEKKDCAYWKNLLPLHDLTIKRNGKAKKDKN